MKCRRYNEPDMFTQMVRKQFFSVTDVHVIGKINSQTILVCDWYSHKIPNGGVRMTQNKSIQKTLCNRCPVQLGN